MPTFEIGDRVEFDDGDKSRSFVGTIDRTRCLGVAAVVVHVDSDGSFRMIVEKNLKFMKKI